MRPWSAQTPLHYTHLPEDPAGSDRRAIEGNYLHLVFAGLSALSAAYYLLRTRRRGGSRNESLAKVALGCSVAWIVGVFVLAFGYAWLMKDFH